MSACESVLYEVVGPSLRFIGGRFGLKFSGCGLSNVGVDVCPWAALSLLMAASDEEEDEAWSRDHQAGVAAEMAAANAPASSAIVLFTPGNLSPPEEPVPEPSELDVDAQDVMRLCEEQAQVVQIYLIQSGLVGSLLALQKGDESALLLQASPCQINHCYRSSDHSEEGYAEGTADH